MYQFQYFIAVSQSKIVRGIEWRCNSLDDQIVNPFLLQAIRDRLGDQHAHHDWHNIVEGIGQFEDDHSERDGRSGDTGERRCGANLPLTISTLLFCDICTQWKRPRGGACRARNRRTAETLTIAYRPGTMQSSSLHTPNMLKSGCEYSTYSIASPTIRPKQAPTARDGMKIPAGVESQHICTEPAPS